MAEWAIEAENLVKKFDRKVMTGGEDNPGEKAVKVLTKKHSGWPFRGKAVHSIFTAVDGVSFKIERGEVFGLLGPNGAGKSTTIRMLCTLLEPSAGTARLNGYDIQKQANQVRQSLGAVLGGERSVYWKLTARENLEYFAALYHIPPEIASKRIKMLLERVELTARADELVEKFSSGMKQRVAIARSLLSDPPIILLDEPTLGLDPQAARHVREMVNELKAEGHTILLTTHYMEEADQLSDRIGIIDQGKIIALDTPAALKRRISQSDVIRLEISGWHADLGGVLKALPGIETLATSYMGVDSLWEVNLHASNSRQVLPGIIENINQNGTRLVNMNIVQPTLEDVFINLTGKALRD
jgi:ABC-2 type transport system ATP-binding protein